MRTMNAEHQAQLQLLLTSKDEEMAAMQEEHKRRYNELEAQMLKVTQENEDALLELKNAYDETHTKRSEMHRSKSRSFWEKAEERMKQSEEQREAMIARMKNEHMSEIDRYERMLEERKAEIDRAHQVCPCHGRCTMDYGVAY